MRAARSSSRSGTSPLAIDHPSRHATQSIRCTPLAPSRQENVPAPYRPASYQSEQTRRRRGVISRGLLTEDPSETPWYKKDTPGSDIWEEVPDGTALKEAVLCKDGKYVAVDMFAGWCASCKNAYPALCKIATSEGLQRSFTFRKCNVENPQVKEFLKEHFVKGIPAVLVFSPKGERDFLGRTKPGLIATLPATFKKIEGVRESLEIIATNSMTQKYIVNKETGRVSLG